jgi:hypothetical protein
MNTNTDVTDFLTNLEHPRKPAIEAVRRIILDIDPRIRESIKWNAPSFYIDDHVATFQLAPRDTFQLILHTGAKPKGNPSNIKIDDPDKLLKWPAPDRCVTSFEDAEDVQNKTTAIIAIVKQWIGQL